jgi:hypothetical protein
MDGLNEKLDHLLPLLQEVRCTSTEGRPDKRQLQSG